jgi:hypothetical protein
LLGIAVTPFACGDMASHLDLNVQQSQHRGTLPSERGWL